jgi:hypothetical protein
MSRLASLIQALIPRFPTRQELDEAYLNDAVDIFDIERRMAEIDHRPNDWSVNVPAFSFNLH